MSATSTSASHPEPMLTPIPAAATASTSLFESPIATLRDNGIPTCSHTARMPTAFDRCEGRTSMGT